MHFARKFHTTLLPHVIPPLNLLAEFARRHTGGARKQAAERGDILVADSIANLSHTEPSALQQLARGIDALLLDPFARTGLQFIEKSPGQRSANGSS